MASCPAAKVSGEAPLSLLKAETQRFTPPEPLLDVGDTLKPYPPHPRPTPQARRHCRL